MDTNYFNPFKAQIENLAQKTKEWSSYFVVSMSKFDIKNDVKSKFVLMLHELTFGKLKEVISHYIEKYTIVNNAKKKILDLWLQYEEDLKVLNLKPFSIYFKNFNSFVDHSMININDNSISINLKDGDLKYEICFLNITISQKMKILSDKREQLIDFLKSLNNQIDQYSNVLTLFFFFHYEELPNKEITLATFQSEEFKNYIEENIAESKQINKFFSISETIKNFKLPFEIYQQINKLNVDYETYFTQHENKQKALINDQPNNLNIRYIQHYLNKDQYLTAFMVGKQHGYFTIGVQNFLIDFQEDTKPILSFQTYYTQYLFTQIFKERYIRDSLEILFYHFCCFLKEEINQQITLVQFDSDTLIFFQAFLQKIETQLKNPNISNMNGDIQLDQMNPNQLYNFQQQLQLQQPLQQQYGGLRNDLENGDQVIFQDCQQHLFKQIHEKFLIQSKDQANRQQQSNINLEEQKIQEQRIIQLDIQQGLENEKINLEAYKQKIAELESEIDQLKLNCQSKEQEMDQMKKNYQEKIQLGDDLIIKLQEQQIDYQKQIEDLVNQQEIQQQPYDQKQKNQIQQQNEEYNNKVIQNVQDQKIEKHQKKIKELNDEIQLLKKEVETLRQELNQKEQILKVSNEDFKRVCNEKLFLDNQIEEKEAFIKKQNDSFEVIKLQLASVQEENVNLNNLNEQNQQKLIKQNENYEFSISNSIHLDDAKQFMAHMFNSVKQLQINSNNLLMNPLIASCNAIQNKVNGEYSEQNNIELKNPKDYYSQTIKHILNEIKSFNKQINSVNKQLTTLHSAITEIQTSQDLSSQQQNNQVQQLAKQVFEKEEALKQLQEKIEANIYQLDSIEQEKQIQQIQEKERERVQNEIKKNEELQANLERLNESYQKVIQEKDSLQIQINNLNEQNQQLINQTQNQANHNNLNTQMHQKQQEYDSLNNFILQKEQELQSLSSRVNNTLNSNQQIQKQNNNGISELNDSMMNKTIIQDQQPNLKNNMQVASHLKNFFQSITKASSLNVELNQKYQELQEEPNISQLSQSLNNRINSNFELQKDSVKMEEELETNKDYEQHSPQKENQNLSELSEKQNGHNTYYDLSYNSQINIQMSNFQPQQGGSEKKLQIESNSIFLPQAQQGIQDQTINQIEQSYKIQSLSSQNFQDSQNIRQYRSTQFSLTMTPQASSYDRTIHSFVDQQLDFNQNLFLQIFNNPQVFQKLTKFFWENHQIKIQVLNSQSDDFNLIDSREVTSIYIIDPPQNAFIQILKHGGMNFFIWSGSIKYSAKCNRSINYEFFNKNIAKQIEKQSGNISKELGVQTQNKQNEIALLLLNHLTEEKKDFLFNFILYLNKSDQESRTQIKYLNKITEETIKEIKVQFLNNQTAEMLVLIINNSFFYTYRFFIKNNGNIHSVYQICIKYIYLFDNKVKEMIQTEEKIDQILQVSQHSTFINSNREQQAFHLTKIFLMTYAPLIILQKLEKTDIISEKQFQELNQSFLKIESYNLYTLQQNFI